MREQLWQFLTNLLSNITTKRCERVLSHQNRKNICQHTLQNETG